MKFLKGLAISLLSFLLFLCLSTFGMVFMLNQTLLNPDFITSQISKLDLSSLAKETVINQISQDMTRQFSQQFPEAGELIPQILNQTMDDLEPWVKEKAGEITHATYDYMVGKSQSLSLTISLAPVKDSLAANLRETLLESPPPQLAAVPPAMLTQIVGGIEQQLTQEIPATFDLNETMFPPEVTNNLDQVRQYLGYVQTASPMLIGAMVVLALLIILIHRSVKGATRSLGSTILTYGILGYAGIYASQYLIGMQTGAMGLPAALEAWLPQFINAMQAPVQMFNIAVAVAGVMLIIFSIVYPKKQEATD